MECKKETHQLLSLVLVIAELAVQSLKLCFGPNWEWIPWDQGLLTGVGLLWWLLSAVLWCWIESADVQLRLPKSVACPPRLNERFVFFKKWLPDDRLFLHVAPLNGVVLGGWNCC